MEKKIFYPTYNNYNLCGILNNINGEKSITVICHARTSSKDSRPTTMLSKALTKNSINNFRFDFISCGESEGDFKEYTVSNMIKNLEDTLEMLKNNYNYNKFILVGCSMGGRIVSLIDTNKFNIEKIILWYPALNYRRGIFNIPSKKERKAKKIGYYVIEKGYKLSYEYFVDERKYRAYKNLNKMDVPILLIHGTKGPYIDYKYSVNISRKCKNSELFLIENGDHGFHEENNIKQALDKTIYFIKS